MKNLTKILLSIYVAIMMIAVACKKDDPTPKPPVTTPTTTPPIVTKSTAKDLTKFSFAALSPVVDATIDAIGKTIAATVGTEAVEKLVPTFTVSDKATVSPASGVAQDFSKEVSYTVTAEDGTTQIWKVSVKIDASVAKVCRLQTIDKGSNGINTYEYDTKKRLTKVTSKDAKGAITSTETYEYNADGTLKTYNSVSSGFLFGISYTYENGRRIGQKMTVGTNTYISKFEYDSNGNLIKQIDAEGTINYANGKTASMISTTGSVYTLNEMGFVTKLVNPYKYVTTYEYDKDGQQIKTESFDDKGVRYYYTTTEYSTTKISKISSPDPSVDSKGGFQIIPSYGTNNYYRKRYISTSVDVKSGVEAKGSDDVYDYKLDSKGKIQSFTYTNNVYNFTIASTYNYQECD